MGREKGHRMKGCDGLHTYTSGDYLHGLEHFLYVVSIPATPAELEVEHCLL